MPHMPPGWDADQQRRYLDALLAYVAAPSDETREQFLMAAPGIEEEALSFATALIAWPGSQWVPLLGELRAALDTTPVPSLPDPPPGYEQVALLGQPQITAVWQAYWYWPGEDTYADLLTAAGRDAGTWLAYFADSLRGYPDSAWCHRLLRPKPRRRQRAGQSRPLPSFRWTTVVAATAVVVVLAATAVVLGTRSTTSPSALNPSLVASWRLAGDIDQPAWQVATGRNAEPLPLLTCPGSTTCFASLTAGSGSFVVEATTDGGSAWEARNLPNSVRLTAALACPTQSICVGTGAAPSTTGPGEEVAVVTADGGTSWTEHDLPADVAKVEALTCPTVVTCVGVATTAPGTSTTPGGQTIAVRSTDGGTSWSTVTLPSPVYPSDSALACSSPTDCVLAGTTTEVAPGQTATTTAVALVTNDGGVHWALMTLPRGLERMRAVSCAPGGGCLALAERTATMAFDHYTVLRLAIPGGRSWQVVAGAGFSLAFVSSLSCPAANDCWASGRSKPTAGQRSSGAIAVTHDGGTSWTIATLPHRLTAARARAFGTDHLDFTTISAVSCPHVDVCVAMGTEALSAPQVVFRDDGA